MAPAQPYFSGMVAPSRPSAPISLKDRAVGLLLQIGLDHAGAELFLRVGAGGVAYGALVLGELVLEEERILPVEGCGAWLARATCPAFSVTSRRVAPVRCTAAYTVLSRTQRFDRFAAGQSTHNRIN